MTALPVPILAAPTRARSRALPLTVAAILVLALLPRLGFLARPWESDAGLYAYMGKVVAEPQFRGQLYRDFYETKPPGVALLTAGLYQTLGQHWPAWVALQTVLTLAASAALARAASRAWGASAGLATFCFAAVFLNLGPVAYRGFQLETLVASFAALAAACGWKVLKPSKSGSDILAANHSGADILVCPERPSRTPSTFPSPQQNLQSVLIPSLLLGLLSSLAANVKPTGGAVLAAFAIACIYNKRLKPVLFATLGFLIPTAAVFLWTWHAGLLPEMPAVFREISLYGSGTPIRWSEIFLKWGTIVTLIALTFHTAARFARLQNDDSIKRNQSRDSTPASGNAVPLFLLFWLTFEILAVYLQKRMYAYHFLPLAPPLALLFGSLFRRATSIRPLGLVAALAPALALSLAWSAGDLKALAPTGPRPLAESAYLLAHAAPTDRIVGDGIERLLMETNLRPGSRYAHLFYLANHDAAPHEFGERFLADLQTFQPEWALFPTNWKSARENSARELPLYAESPTRAQAFLNITAQIQSHIEVHYTPQTQFGPQTLWRRKSQSTN